MNPSHSLVCTGCSQPFSKSNLPRLAPCSHTYCQQCLTSLDHCAIDQQPYDLLTSAEDLPINTAIMKFIEAQEVKNAQEREIDLVCIDDHVGICTNCALFGEHKNHNIKTVNQVFQECAAMAEQTISILSGIEDLQSTGSAKALQSKIQAAFKDKKEILAKQIKAKFFKIVEAVKSAEKACLTDLDKAVEEEKNSLRGLVPKIGDDERKRSWIKEAERLIQVVDSHKLDEAARYLNSGCPESSLLKKGEYLIMELNSRQSLICDQLTESVNALTCETGAWAFEAQLSNYCKLKRTKQEEPNPKTERVVDDEFLLEQEEEMFPITPSTIERHQAVDSASSSMFIDIAQLTLEKTGINVQSFAEKSERKMVDRSMVKEPLGVSNLDNRKKRKLKIPEKYEAVFDDLKADRMECIDFTNAELGDAILIQLVEYIRSSTKLRTVKLIRNKLSDECLPHLLDACRESRIVSLNLGQNALTDKALEILEKAELKQLRNLTLSQNKINQRNSKARIAEFKKRGLTISI